MSRYMRIDRATKGVIVPVIFHLLSYLLSPQPALFYQTSFPRLPCQAPVRIGQWEELARDWQEGKGDKQGTPSPFSLLLQYLWLCLLSFSSDQVASPPLPQFQHTQVVLPFGYQASRPFFVPSALGRQCFLKLLMSGIPCPPLCSISFLTHCS